MPPSKTAPPTPQPTNNAPVFNAPQANQDFASQYGNAINSAIQSQPGLTSSNIGSLNSVASNNLGLQQQQAPAYAQTALNSLNVLDPNATALRSQLEGSASQQLGLGTSLDPAYASQLQQSIRGAQSARGNSLGDAAGNAEALSLGSAGLAMQQQREGFANSVAGLGGIGALDSEVPGIGNFGTNGMAAYNGITPDLGLAGPTYGTQTQANANQAFGTEGSEYNAGLGYGANTYATATNAPNPWMQGLGLALGAGSALGAGALTGGAAPAAGAGLGLASGALNQAVSSNAANSVGLRNGYNSP